MKAAKLHTKWKFESEAVAGFLFLFSSHFSYFIKLKKIELLE